MDMQPPPGWYPDPSGAPDSLRWWDGTAWTGATHAAYPQPGPGQGYAAPGDPYQQGAYPQSGYGPGGYEQGGYPDQGGYAEAAYQQGGYPPGGYDQGEYAQGGYPQSGYDYSGYAQQPGYEQGGYGYQYGQEWPGGQGWGEQWPQQAGAERPRKTWPWLVAGGAGLVVVIAVAVVGLFATNVIGGSQAPPVAGPTGSDGGTQAPGGANSSVVGEITDQEAGLTYAKLGGKWAAIQPGGEHGMADWTAGQYQVAQADYQDGRDYLATCLSAPLPETTGYSGPGDLEAAATATADQIQVSYYPQQHTRDDVESTAVEVDGHRAWKITFDLTFPQAEANGWEFQGERVVVMVIDRGDGNTPGVFYFSLPDNLQLQSDIDAVVSSIKVTG